MSEFKKTTKKAVIQTAKKNNAIQKKKVAFSKPANDISMLQKSVGNQAVQQLFKKAFKIHATKNYESDVIHSLNITMNKALIMGNDYAIAVFNACEDFKKYSKSKIKELEGRVTGAELASALGNTILTVIGGVAASKITAKITSEIAKSIVGVFKSEILTGVKKATLSKGSDIKDLRESIDFITQGARDASIKMKDHIKAVLEPKISKIQEKVSLREELTPDEDDFVATFYLSSANTMREDITSYLGIPDNKNAIEIQIKIYQELIEEFEKKYFMATTSVYKSLYWISRANQSGDGRSGAGEYAYNKAKDIADKRREELKHKTQ